jgi:glycosyltransferase involved in cell wall biosynthesis
MYPRREGPGSGLIPYNLTVGLKLPTLLILKNYGPITLPLTDNVNIKYIKYWENSFPKKYKINIIRMGIIIIGKLLGNISLIFKALPSILKFKPDIIHIHTPLQILLAISAKLYLRVPLVLTYHGTDFNRLRRNKILLKLIHFFVDHTICISEDIYAKMIQIENNKTISYVPNGVDLSLFKNNNTEKLDQIITVGRLVWQKGLPILIEAFAKFVKLNPNFKLVIIGEGEERNNIINIIDKLNIGDNVVLEGLLSQKEIVIKLNQSKFFIMSSISEGFPKALIEAMACGLPCISTNVGSCSSIINGAGLAVEKESVEQLFESMVKMIEDKSLRDNFSKEAIKLSTQYSWDTRGNKVKNIYNSLMKND